MSATNLMETASRTRELAQCLVERFSGKQTLAVAESLTGGLLAAAIVDIPGASQCFVAGVCTYTYAAKHLLLGIDTGYLAREGAVNAYTAEQMARSVAKLVGADWSAATTGVAGPGPDRGITAGTAFVAVTHRESQRTWSRRVFCPGSRAQVRAAVTLQALELLTQLSADPSAISSFESQWRRFP